MTSYILRAVLNDLISCMTRTTFVVGITADKVTSVNVSMERPRIVPLMGSRGKSKSEEIAIDDNMTIGAMKDLIARRLAVGRYKSEMSIAEASKSGSKVKIVREEVPADTDPNSNLKEGHSVVKKRKSGWLKFISEEKGMHTEPMENEDNIRTPMKRKRGPDGELVQAYLSSPEQHQSRLRPRKEVPSFRMVDLEEDDYRRIVGKRVKVYWSESRKWFAGHIKAFDDKKRLHSILYDDGDKEELDLRKERFELEIMPTENFRLRVESISRKKPVLLDFHEQNTNISLEKKFKIGVTKKMIKGLESSSGVSNLYEEFDESKSLAEIARVAAKKLEMQTAQVRPSAEVKKMGSDTDDTEGSKKTNTDDSMYLTCAELLNRLGKDMKGSKLLCRKEIDKAGTLDAEMEVDSHDDGLKKSMVHSDVGVKEAVKVNH